MFDLVFYESRRGESKIVDWLDELGQKAKTNKEDWLERHRNEKS